MSFATIHAAACEHPAKPAVVYNGTVISYAAFARAIGDTSRYLATQELPAGHTVAVITHNLLDCWAVVLALQHLGLNTVCVASVAVLDTLGLQSIAGTVTTALEIPDHQLEPNAKTGNRVIAIPNPAFGSDELSPARAVKQSANIGGHILYTSGTTGRYKKLFFSADLQRQRDAEGMETRQWDAHTVNHCSIFGLWTGVGYKGPLSVWHARGCVIIDQRPQWYEHFMQSGMTHAFLIPDMANQLLSTLDAQGRSSAPLDFQLTIAGGFISRKLAEQLVRRVTTNLRILYGSTETNVLVLEAKVTHLDDLHWLHAAGYRTVEIIDEAGNLCPMGVEGQLRVRLSELDCCSYLDDPQASEKVFRSGYFYPGDMALRRADGRIRILGRSADVVNFRGQKIAVAPIEHAIQDRLGVDNVCLFSGINNAGEEEVVIAIDSEHWPEQADLNNLGHEFAQFDQVRFALVHPFPRTQAGTSKINRIALRKLVFPAIDRAAAPIA